MRNVCVYVEHDRDRHMVIVRELVEEEQKGEPLAQEWEHIKECGVKREP